jgi:TonB family protein
LLSFFSARGVAAQHAAPIATAAEVQADLLYSPRPSYPREAEFRGVQGVGTFQVEVNTETGKVFAVSVAKSSGYKALDEATIDALKRWRLKPHTAAAFYFQMGYVPERELGNPLAAVQKYATYSPMPQAPLQARADIQSPIRGEYQLLIDRTTGRVTDVKVLIPSHSDLLDRTARTAFAQWRFMPNTIGQVVVPLEAYPIWHR